MSLPPANWYPDPTAPGTERYWDGGAWSASTRVVAAPQAPAGPTFTPQAPAGPTFTPQAAAGPTFTPQAPAGPTFTPQAPAGPTFTPQAAAAQMFPPPAPADMVFAPKRSRKGLWITLGAVGLLVVVGLGVTGAIALVGKVAPLSNNYTGAPVTAADVASAGKTEVISSSDTVALEIPQQWVNAADYADLSGVSAGLPAGTGLLGAWFTAVPGGTNPPQMVIVFEAASSAAGIGSLSDFQNQAIGGLRRSDTFSGVDATTDVTSTNGLEGKRTTATLDMDQGITATTVLETFGHSRRLALVMWTSYSGPVDETALQAMTDSLRIDS